MASTVFEGHDETMSVSSDEAAYYDIVPSRTLGPLLRQILSIARRNLWLILATITTFLFVAAVITILQTPKYTAETSIEIANRSDEVLGDQLDPTSQEADNWDVDRFLNTQISILTSRSLADRVAKKLNLYSDPRFYSAMQLNPDDFLTETDKRNGVIAAVMDNFSANLPVDSRMVRLHFTSTDPKLSASVTNAFAEEFIQANLQRRFNSSSYAREFVQQQLEQARSRLEASEQSLNAYAREAGLIRPRTSNNNQQSSDSSVTTSSLMQLNEAANTAQAKRVSVEAQWRAEQSAPLLSSPAALASPAVQQLLSRRSDLQAQLDTARDRYLADHPTVQRLTSELRNTDEQLTRAATEARNAVRAEFIAAQAAEQNLRSQVDRLEGATLQEQDRSVRYNTLAREADTNRSIYDGLLQRYRELNASAGITASNVSVIDAAEPPVDPSSPNPVLNMGVALILGILAAAVVVFLFHQLDDRVRVPEEIEEKVGLNLVGVIPQVKGEDPIESLQDPKSIISESYNALRTSLLFSTRSGLPNLMVVTSAQASEGKSTTSYAIARSMALVGKRTLLIDADLRRPSVHRMTGVDNKVGLSNVLVGEKSIEEVVVPGEVPNLFVVPSGPVPPSPAELLSSPRLFELFDILRNKYDSIIVDSAPVLGLADSPGLAALADGVLLVIEADRGRGGQLKAAVRRLRMIKPAIVGAVLTKFNPEAAGNAYSTYYQYDYYRYRSDDHEIV